MRASHCPWVVVPLLLASSLFVCRCEDCLSDTIPLREETRQIVTELLEELEHSPLLKTGRFVNWTEDFTEKAAFLPRGSKLRGDMSTDRRGLREFDGSVSFDRPQKRYLPGPAPEPLRVYLLNWPSAHVMGHVFRILAEEPLRYWVDFSGNSSFSASGVLAIAGCTAQRNADGAVRCEEVEQPSDHRPSAHVLLEGWESAADVYARLPRWARPVEAGSLDYLGREAIFLRSDVVESADFEGSQSPPLDFYRSYNLSVYPNTQNYFDSLSDVLGNVSLEHVTPCDQWPGVTPKDIQDYQDNTGDAGGWRLDAGGAAAPQCAHGGRVWLSEACRGGAAWRCVPFVTYSGYYVPEMMQMSFNWRMPVAILDLNESAWRWAGSNLRVLVMWWIPDPTFEGLQVISLPYADKEELARGTYRTGQHGDLTKYAWQGLAGAAPDADDLVKEFSLNTRDIGEAMHRLHLGHDASAEACRWVRRSWGRWQGWLPGPCQHGTELKEDGLCHLCQPGFFEESSECLPCAAGRFAPDVGSRECLECPGRLWSEEGQALCSSVEMKQYAGMIAIIALSGVIGMLTAGGCAYGFARRRFHVIKVDSPTAWDMPTGRWVLQCAGKHIEVPGRLCQLSPDSVVRSNFASQFVGASHPDRWLRGRKQASFWIINASPFIVDLSWEDCEVNMDPESYWQASCPLPSEMHLCAASDKKPRHEWEHMSEQRLLEFTVQDGDWRQVPTERESFGTGPVQYLFPVIRKLLPDASDGRRMGHLKLTKNPVVGNLLISWSPPPTMRGVPLPEFEHFLTEVIDHEDTWDCTEEKQHGKTMTVRKRRGSSKRNMYDACEHLIMREVACLDASYAELKTNYGPPNLFISHVWKETAYNTRSAIAKLREHLFSRKGGISSVRLPRLQCSSSADSLEAKAEFRVWFCTICNNQSRVREELGNDVQLSPFAQVLQSLSCQRVALISPFMALERKWCNYEFCAAKHSGKQVLMVTSEGIVQAGQVAPKTLDKLSRKVVAFNCEKATCTCPHDAELITRAVSQMGGYKALNAELKEIFQDAIKEAHLWAKTALDRMQIEPSAMLPSNSGQRSAWQSSSTVQSLGEQEVVSVQVDEMSFDSSEEQGQESDDDDDIIHV